MRPTLEKGIETNSIGFTKQELKEIDVYRSYFNSKDKQKKFPDLSIFWYPSSQMSYGDVNLATKKFAETGDTKDIIDLIRKYKFDAMKHPVMHTLLNIIPFKYQDAKMGGNKGLEKRIKKFFGQLGRALRNYKYDKISLLMVRLEQYISRNNLETNAKFFLRDTYYEKLEEYKKKGAYELKKINKQVVDLKKKIKDQSKKINPIDSGENQARKDKKERLEKLKKESSKLKKDRKNMGHKVAKQETLKKLEEITSVRLKPRNFEDLIKEANKWYSEIKAAIYKVYYK